MLLAKPTCGHPSGTPVSWDTTQLGQLLDVPSWAAPRTPVPIALSPAAPAWASRRVPLQRHFSPMTCASQKNRCIFDADLYLMSGIIVQSMFKQKVTASCQSRAGTCSASSGTALFSSALPVAWFRWPLCVCIIFRTISEIMASDFPGQSRRTAVLAVVR